MFPRALGQSGTSAGRLRLRGPGAGIALGIAAVALGAGLAACGGGERQDATVPSGSYPVQVTQAKFANHQKLSETTYLQLGIRNAGSKTIPNLAVTINTVEQGQPNVKSPAYSTGSSGSSRSTIRRS
jgi:ABC-type glycerol-3-phosphate transport system substrate-binding protein